MAIKVDGRHPRVQELAVALQADKSWTGKRRAMGQVLEAFVKGLLRDLEDSSELISALEGLLMTRNALIKAVVDPHKPSKTVVRSDANKPFALGGGHKTSVTTGHAKSADNA